MLKDPKQISKTIHNQDSVATPNQLYHIHARAPHMRGVQLTKREASLIIQALTTIPLIKE